tara:strand:- start:115481 stop:115717 length:237 start_codon:yes stop_codon:yes gene_type:complete
MKDLYTKLKEGNSNEVINGIKDKLKESVGYKINERESEILTGYSFVSEEKEPEEDDEEDLDDEKYSDSDDEEKDKDEE